MLLGVRGRPAGVCPWFSPSTMWAQVIKLVPSDMASTFMLSHLDSPTFKWTYFKSIVLLIIIKTSSNYNFTLSFYKPFLTTPVCIDFAFIGFDDFSMCWLVSKCFVPLQPQPLLPASDPVPFLYQHMWFFFPLWELRTQGKSVWKEYALAFASTHGHYSFNFHFEFFLLARRTELIFSLQLINSGCLAVHSPRILCNAHLSPEAVTLLCPIPVTHICVYISASPADIRLVAEIFDVSLLAWFPLVNPSTKS